MGVYSCGLLSRMLGPKYFHCQFAIFVLNEEMTLNPAVGVYRRQPRKRRLRRSDRLSSKNPFTQWVRGATAGFTASGWFDHGFTMGTLMFGIYPLASPIWAPPGASSLRSLRSLRQNRILKFCFCHKERIERKDRAHILSPNSVNNLHGRCGLWERPRGTESIESSERVVSGALQLAREKHFAQIAQKHGQPTNVGQLSRACY